MAITAPSASANGKPEIKELVKVDLNSRKDRIRKIRHLIDIACLSLLSVPLLKTLPFYRRKLSILGATLAIDLL